METVLRFVTAIILISGLAGPPVEARAAAHAASGADFCGLYCDTIYVGCKVTIGRLDSEACEEYHEGCLDGCEVEH